jgi:transposase
MVLYAIEHTNKDAAILFGTSVKTVAKWRKRFEEQGFQGLFNLSKRPKNSPNAISQEIKDFVIALKKKYPRLSAEIIKNLEGLQISPRTIRKIWRTAGISGRRRKKYQTKNNLRHIKKKFNLFQFSMEDTKHLYDIPEYYGFMKQYELPVYQYTFREVSTGIVIMGFSNNLSMLNSSLFTLYVNYCIEKAGIPLKEDIAYIRQTDNGSEYIGSMMGKNKSFYRQVVEKSGFVHRTIFPGAHRMQADVETFHDIVEREFFEIEHFHSREEFMQKAYSYQLFFNLKRTNTYKENKTPYELAKEKEPDISDSFFRMPPIDLDYAADLLYKYHTNQPAMSLPIPIIQSVLLHSSLKYV